MPGPAFAVLDLPALAAPLLALPVLTLPVLERYFFLLLGAAFFAAVDLAFVFD